MLDALTELRHSYAQRIRPLRVALLGLSMLPSNAPEVCALLGQIGGEARRYRQDLAIALTTWAIDHSPQAEATKFRVQAWQKSTFGHAVSNSVAVRWCDPERDPGDRGALDVPAVISAAAGAVYRTYWPTPDKALDGDPEQLAAQVGNAVLGKPVEASAA